VFCNLPQVTRKSQIGLQTVIVYVMVYWYCTYYSVSVLSLIFFVPCTGCGSGGSTCNHWYEILQLQWAFKEILKLTNLMDFPPLFTRMELRRHNLICMTINTPGREGSVAVSCFFLPLAFIVVDVYCSALHSWHFPEDPFKSH
jgi:hypothetical protein